MRPVPSFAACAALSLSLSLGAAPASAAESYDGCSGFITVLPATIDTQGVWCLKQDLATAIATGTAITVNANNVAIDCNGFKIGGLGAGPTTLTNGIGGNNRLNTTVRGCNIRGFRFGINFLGGSGLLFENNRIEGSTVLGILVEADNGVIRGNAILDSGAVSGMGFAAGIYATGGFDILGNLVNGVYPPGPDRSAYGIVVEQNDDGLIADNRVRGLVTAGDGGTVGIQATGSYLQIHGNHLVGEGPLAGKGIVCTNAKGLATRNQISAFLIPIETCTAADNWHNPN